MGRLVPPQWQPEQIAELAYSVGPDWRNLDNLVVITAIAFAECDGFIYSYNDNLAADGKTVSSRDVGIWEINIPASAIGTQREKDLLVPHNNAAAAYALFKARGFQPWASYNTGICFDDTYLLRALLGVTNLAAKRAEVYQVARPDRAAHHSLQVDPPGTPFVTAATWRKIHPAR